MAEPGDELLEGDLGDGEYNELDADEEDALLADDNGYAGYNLPSVSAHRDVYISSSPDAKTQRKIKVEDVEDVAEGDEILDDEDVLELGVEGNWNLDDLDSETQDQNRISERKKSLWIKQERIDSIEFSGSHESNEVREEQNVSSDVSSLPKKTISKNVVITSSADISQSHLNDDEDDDDHERRDRFKNERSLPGIISLKPSDNKWGEIPDSLDSVITESPTKPAGQKSPRGGGTGGRGGTPIRRGGGFGRGGLRQAPAGSPHKVLINPHFKGAPQANTGNTYGDVPQPQPYFDQPGSQYQKHQEFHQYQPPANSQYPPHSQPHYQEPGEMHLNAQGPPPSQGPHYQNTWQNANAPPQHYDQHNYPPHFQGARAPPPPSWDTPGQPVYHDYHQPPHHQPPHPHHQQLPHHHQPPHHQPMPPHPHAMRPDASNIHHIVSQQQPPPPGLESEFQSRKVQFSNENKSITVQMYSESAPGNVSGPPARNQFGNKMAPGQYYNRPPGHFHHQGPPRPFFPPQHQPHPPQGSFFIPNQQQQPRMFPPAPPNHLQPRFPPRFKRGGFQRGGFSPQFRHPLGPRMMQPVTPSSNVVCDARIQNFQQQPIKRTHPEPQIPHEPPFKQMRPNLNCKDVVSAPKPVPVTRVRNLLEVQTVDNVPDTTTFSDQGNEGDDDDDEEIREYKRKIAEQKRLREKFLQEKEERRKLAAYAKQKEIEQRKVTGQNVPNFQPTPKSQTPTVYGQSGQQSMIVSGQINHEETRISVHKRIGVKHSPINQMAPGSTQITVFNEHQPTAFKIVRVRTKDGTVLIKKLPMNSAGQVMIQRPAHMPPPPHVVHHQPALARQQNNPHPLPHPHHHPHPHPPHPHHNYPHQQVPLPTPPQPQLQHNQYFHPNQPYQQPYTVQEPFYHQPEQVKSTPIVQTHNPVPIINNKRIVLDQPALQGANTFKQNFSNRGRVRPVLKKSVSNNMSSVITIVPVNKNMTLGQRFTMQNQQVKKDQNQQQQHKQEQKLPVQAQSGTKPNRTVINSVLNAGTPTIKMIPLPPGPVTNKVVVDNLTAGTSRQQLVGMAEQVGEVKILTLDTSQKRATITFNNSKAATAFYQKFQRKMVNLSMINVSFVPE